jgi:peptidoglycan hydrolase CwlO-like protein
MKNILNTIGHFMLTILRNKYLVVVTFFIIWVAFLDTYNLVDRYKNLKRLNHLKSEAQFFRDEIESLNKQYQEIFSEKKDLEKFARETFLMKENNEDVFIIIDE